MAFHDKKNTAVRLLHIALLVIQAFYFVNLSTLYLCPNVEEQFVPRHHYLAAPQLIELDKYNGTAYTEEEAIERAFSKAQDSFIYTGVCLLLTILSFVFKRKHLTIACDICWASSLMLFIFVLFLL